MRPVRIRPTVRLWSSVSQTPEQGCSPCLITPFMIKRPAKGQRASVFQFPLPPHSVIWGLGVSLTPDPRACPGPSWPHSHVSSGSLPPMTGRILNKPEASGKTTHMCTSREYCHVLSPGRRRAGCASFSPRLARTWASGQTETPPNLLGASVVEAGLGAAASLRRSRVLLAGARVQGLRPAAHQGALQTGVRGLTNPDSPSLQFWRLADLASAEAASSFTDGIVFTCRSGQGPLSPGP